MRKKTHYGDGCALCDVKQFGFQRTTKSAKQFNSSTVIRKWIPCCRGAVREGFRCERHARYRIANSCLQSVMSVVSCSVNTPSSLGLLRSAAGWPRFVRDQRKLFCSWCFARIGNQWSWWRNSVALADWAASLARSVLPEASWGCITSRNVHLSSSVFCSSTSVLFSRYDGCTPFSSVFRQSLQFFIAFVAYY